MTEIDIEKRLINNDALFNNIFVFQQQFDIEPKDNEHFGASIAYQDIQELRKDFLDSLIDTVVEWIYDSEKFISLREQFIAEGRTESSASSAVIRKAKNKFRKSDEHLLIQGQLGELLLFHFIQRTQKATPLLRKMKITTSSNHERFGADAIHYKVDGNKNIIILGEAKAYTSKYKFAEAFENAIDSILDTYDNYREEIKSYLHEDFLDTAMDLVAEQLLNNTLPNVEIELVSLILYNETARISITNQEDIKLQIKKIISEKYNDFDNSKIDIEKNPILKRITYIVFPIWDFEKLAEEFQNMF